MKRATPRILVVDDVTDVRDAAEAILSAEGYEITAVSTAEEALAALAREPAPDLLFTDIMLGPGLNGFQLAQRAVRLRPGLKVLYATGYAWNLEDLYVAVPSSRLMPKPYRGTQLAQEVALLLGDGAAAPRPARVAATLPPATATSQTAILVLEDDTRSRTIAVELFAGLGLAVFDAGNGRDALNLLAAHPEIGVLFADVRLPDMSGIAVAEAARKLRPDLKVVLTSAYTDAELPAMPGMIFVAKPWQPSDFTAIAGSITRH